VNRLEEIFSEEPGSEGFARGYLDYLSEVLASVDTKAIGRFTEVLLDARGARRADLLPGQRRERSHRQPLRERHRDRDREPLPSRSARCR